MLINPTTEHAVEQYLKSPFHALLISGATNSGKTMIMQHIVENLVHAKYDEYPYKTIIDGLTDGVDQVRAVKKEFSYSFASKNPDHNRIVLITSIDAISRESHNALLKILEEPPVSTYIIATCAKTSSLPATIQSRMKQIDVLPLDEHTTNGYLKSHNIDRPQAHNIWLKSTGLAVKIMQYSDSTYSNSELELSKKFLSSKIYDRLAMVNEITKLDKQQQHGALLSISDILYFKLSSNPSSKEILENIQAADKSMELLAENINPKLLWLDLSINMQKC